MAGRVQDWMASLTVGQLRCPHWLSGDIDYVQQRSTLLSSPLCAKLQKVLGPVTYVDKKSTAPVPIEEMEASPFHEGQAPIPSDAWYTDGSSRGQPAIGTAGNSIRNRHDLFCYWCQWTEL